MKISAVIITLNEEKNISRCLTSLLPVADEIIVVDSYSTDKTESICNTFPCKFIQHPFEGYIEQKNFALQQARFEYILSLDADEALSEELIHSINKAKNRNSARAYKMNRLTNYCGQWIRHSAWYPDTKVRLWHKEDGKWGGLNPHDKVVFYEKKSPELLSGNILHYSYYTIAEHYAQAKTFATIAAQAYLQSENYATLFHLFFAPAAKFLKHYLIHLGFLDGIMGWHIARISAWETYLKYLKLYKLQHSSRKKKAYKNIISR